MYLSLCLFFSLQAGHTPESQRSYLLRKRSTTATERTTFVCYTCGTDTPSSQLRLVYCCPNAEREPYYPFIKTMKVYKNASPISPQGECSKQTRSPYRHLLEIIDIRSISRRSIIGFKRKVTIDLIAISTDSPKDNKNIKLTYISNFRHGADLFGLQREAHESGRGRPASAGCSHLRVWSNALAGVHVGHVQHKWYHR